jgi:hypothetical protein
MLGDERHLLERSVRLLVRRVGSCKAEHLVLLAARFSLALSLGVVTAAAAAGGGWSSQAPPAACMHQIDRPRDPGTFVLDRVFFAGYGTPGWHQGAKLQAEPSPEGGWFSKLGLGVRGTADVVLRVPRGREQSVRMSAWAHAPAPVIVSQQSPSGPCPDQVWQTYPGGFVYSKRQCLVLEVAVGKQKARLPFGLGKAC